MGFFLDLGFLWCFSVDVVFHVFLVPGKLA